VTPISHFESVWNRCGQLAALHSYISTNVSGVLRPDELLRAEWVARVSALDLYVHELIAQRMLDIFDGLRPPSRGYLQFQLSNETVNRIRAATTSSDARAAFDLDVRSQLSFLAFQDPEKIAEGIRLCSSVELWNEVALKLGATQSTKTDKAKNLKKELSLVVRRRHIIAHEGDLQPSSIREPWPIAKQDIAFVAERIETIVRSIDGVV
jgi:hypothetical protein